MEGWSVCPSLKKVEFRYNAVTKNDLEALFAVPKPLLTHILVNFPIGSKELEDAMGVFKTKAVSSLEFIDFRLSSPPTGLFEDFVALNKSLHTVHILLNHAVDEGEEAVVDKVIEIAKCFLHAPRLTKLHISHSYFWTTVSEKIAVMLKREFRFRHIHAQLLGNRKW